MSHEHRKLQKRIEELEKELGELKSQMLTLALRPPLVYQYIYQQPVFQPYYGPVTIPYQQPNYPIITCSSGSGNHFQ